MKKNERLLAEKFLLQCISDEEKDFVERTMEKFGVSKHYFRCNLSTVRFYVRSRRANQSFAKFNFNVCR